MSGGSGDNIHALVRMANQIAVAFRAQTHEKAVAATLEHIQLYWSKKMRADILAHLGAGGDGLDAMTREALAGLWTPTEARQNGCGG